MPTQTAPLAFNPQVLAQAVSGGFPEVPILFGSGAVKMDTAMPYGNDYLGLTVNVPYFTSPNAWQVLADGTALTSVVTTIGNGAGNTLVPEVATVKRAGSFMDWTSWAKANPLDPYGEAKQNMLLGFVQAMEDELVTTAASATGWASFTNDVSASAVDNTLSHEAVTDGATLLGSEGWRDGFALGIVNSYTLGQMFKRKDSTGRPWLIAKPGAMMPDGRPIYQIVPLGIPIFVSDRLVPSAGVYTSLFLRKNALALWINPNLSTRAVEVPATDSTQESMNVYFASHRYVRLGGYTKPGVVRILHK